MKKVVYLGMVALSLLALGACSSNKGLTEKSLSSKGKLVVATESEFAPFEFKTLKNGKDTLVGADIELGKAIAKKLGVKVDYSVMSFNNVLATLQSGKSDMAIAGISVTKERQKAYDFSDPYYTSENVVIVKKADLTAYTTADSLNKKSVGTQKGSVQENVAKEQLPTASIVSLTSNGEMISELKSGQLQAVVLEKAIAEGYVAQNDDLIISDQLTLTSTESDTYAVALPKGTDKAVISKVNQAIKEVKESGQFDTWLQEAASYQQSSSN
ncbi:transporter substrate-binding domain-containing protein [Streptococcus saliviloxodontae]|uniref:Polar amino acid transport system substrate-binding protein n=1 Tax=Streptococcus saliviloxodontae TaxID=1349416 RepID=A0ABS2PMW5_9STRE|nr:transporter substrate-binding domain-containing protein [Streptococcus saliviloxodontae]MBM7636627.1 polar amino acid transport system substrate-binding protein [Streptococcus saliviloxodontae]